MTTPAEGLPARERFQRRLVSGAGGVLLNGLLASCRFERAGVEHYQRFWDEGNPVVFALWHGRLLPCTYYHRGQGVATLISRHRDGDYISGVVRGWGYQVIRGSSSRGASDALRRLARSVRQGRSVAITPDGPRGPRERMKMGVLSLAQLTGVPIVPVASGADRAWWFGGWDRFLIPRPFARLRIRYGDPVHVPRDADAAQLEALRAETEATLRALTATVDDEVARR